MGAVKLGLFPLAFFAAVQLTNCGGYSTASQTGTGTSTPAQSQHSVNVSWDVSTSPGVSGYNVYRAAYSGACDSFSKINLALLSTATYTDSEVMNGASYCYAATAVNGSKEESSYSNIVSNVQIPAN
jgi:hypothetical protein